MSMIGADAAVLGDELVSPAWIEVAGDQIVAAGVGPAPGAVDVSVSGTVVPGFVDQHCHGGNRGDFFAGRADAALVGAQLHRRHGTTTLVASLVTASQPDLIEQIRALAPLVDDGTFAGIHLEGPWLSHHRCGAHDPALLRAPEPAEVAALIDAGGGRIIMATVAPELPGAIAAIEQLTAAGVVAAVGHTDCSADQARRAVNSGATVATHLLNQMPAIHKRAGGPVVALLDDPRVTVELIPDGVHVDPALVGFLVRSLGPDRVAAVTDAMGAAGAPDGDYRIGALDVVVSGGVANLAGGGPLAGSTLTMDRALRTLVHDCGIPIEIASALTSRTPAAAMGLADRGRIAAGMRADLVVLEPTTLQLTQVMWAGQWQDQTAPEGSSAVHR